MKLLFLDIDGVLNCHRRHANGVCGLEAHCVAELNRILETVNDLQIVVSSAWRYYVLNGFMTHDDFDMMLQAHGVHCHKRIHGFTRKDSKTMDLTGRSIGSLTDEERAEWDRYGLIERAQQIKDYWYAAAMQRCAVLDDLPLDLANLFQTDKTTGLTSEIADKVILHFGGTGNNGAFAV